jgi:hypothetical protein
MRSPSFLCGSYRYRYGFRVVGGAGIGGLCSRGEVDGPVGLGVGGPGDGGVDIDVEQVGEHCRWEVRRECGQGSAARAAEVDALGPLTGGGTYSQGAEFLRSLVAGTVPRCSWNRDVGGPFDGYAPPA